MTDEWVKVGWMDFFHTTHSNRVRNNFHTAHASLSQISICWSTERKSSLKRCTVGRRKEMAIQRVHFYETPWTKINTNFGMSALMLTCYSNDVGTQGKCE